MPCQRFRLVNFTQAAMVPVAPRSAEGLSAATTWSSVPSKLIALPYLPAEVQMGPLVSVPWLLCPDPSTALVPVPAWKA
jgi:hypothetical protein